MTKLYDVLVKLINKSGVSAFDFVRFLSHATEMVRHEGKSCVAMSASDAEEAMKNFEYGRYEKFDAKAALKTLPYRTFLLESEAFPDPSSNLSKALGKARNRIDDPTINAFLVRISDNKMEVDVLHVDEDDGRTVTCLSYGFDIDSRMSINDMAYKAVGNLTETIGRRNMPKRRNVHDAMVSDLSVLIPCLVWVAKLNGTKSNATPKERRNRNTENIVAVPGDPNVILESDLVPKSKATPAPKKSRGKGGHPGLGVPKKPHMVRGHYRTCRRGRPDEYEKWIPPHPVHPELMSTSNPVLKRT